MVPFELEEPGSLSEARGLLDPADPVFGCVQHLLRFNFVAAIAQRETLGLVKQGS